MRGNALDGSSFVQEAYCLTVWGEETVYTGPKHPFASADLSEKDWQVRCSSSLSRQMQRAKPSRLKSLAKV